MTFEILETRVDHVSPSQLDALLRGWVSGWHQKMIVTPNPEFLLRARRDPYFQAMLNESHLSLPDGTGIRFAVAALSEDRLRFRHTGSDTLPKLAEICEDQGKRLGLFGGLPGSAKEAARELRRQFPQLDVVGIEAGQITVGPDGMLEVDPDDLTAIQREAPDVLAVGLGAGKQEQFIVENLAKLPSVKVAIGVGGTFEYLSGVLRRAPRVMRNSGLEWMWRLWLEPRRVGRIWRASVVFPCVVAYESLQQRRFMKACWNVAPEVLSQLLNKRL